MNGTSFADLPRATRILWGLLAIAAGAAVWFPTAHLFFTGRTEAFFSPQGTAPDAAALARRHMSTWSDPARREAELAVLRRMNPEWDFMWRTFTAWSMANLALREPDAAPEYLEVMDWIIEDTLRLEKQEGHSYFLLSYARDRPFHLDPMRSHFVDGEIALMLAMRRLVAEREEYRPLLKERIGLMVERMRKSPVLSAESYPDECWTFCNAIGLAALRIADVLDGSDHSALIREWIRTAKEKLVEPETGILVSEYTVGGSPMDGPEGSSIWMVAHCLRFVDPAFAEDQYRRAKKHLGRFFVGFGFSREWPATQRNVLDVDSGAVVPLLEAGAGGSGMAFVGAASFGDREYLASLLGSLRCAAFPIRRDGGLRFAASNMVGDAVLLYACVLGPVREEFERRSGRKEASR